MEGALAENKAVKFLVEVILIDCTEGVNPQTPRNELITDPSCLRQVWKCAAFKRMNSGAPGDARLTLEFMTPLSNGWITFGQAFQMQYQGRMRQLKCLMAMNFVSTVVTANDNSDREVAMRGQFFNSYEILDDQLAQYVESTEVNAAMSTGNFHWVYTPEALLYRAAEHFVKQVER